jgi:phosphopantetheinyl transferase
VDAAATGAELLVHAILETTTPTAMVAATPGATVVLFHVPPVVAPDDGRVLGDAERARAARFAFEKDRSAYVTTRAALRRVLASALQCAPADVQLVTPSNGRPALDRAHASSLDFNVSHSGRVGVDIEMHDARRGLRELVPTVMGVRERQLLAQQPDDASFSAAFYDCWTRKEAIVKGIGTGISADLTAIDVAAIPADAVVEVSTAEYRLWRVVTDRVRPDVTVSVALCGCQGPIRILPMAERVL